MKASYLFAALAAFYGVEATTISHVVCSSCPTPSSTNDVVTRSDEPVPSCTVPLIVPVNRTMSTSAGGMPTSTGGVAPQPSMATSNKLAGALGSTLIFTVVAAFCI